MRPGGVLACELVAVFCHPPIGPLDCGDGSPAIPSRLRGPDGFSQVPPLTCRWWPRGWRQAADEGPADRRREGDVRHEERRLVCDIRGRRLRLSVVPDEARPSCVCTDRRHLRPQDHRADRRRRRGEVGHAPDRARAAPTPRARAGPSPTSTSTSTTGSAAPSSRTGPASCG